VAISNKIMREKKRARLRIAARSHNNDLAQTAGQQQIQTTRSKVASGAEVT
jgi:hypothetical protein